LIPVQQASRRMFACCSPIRMYHPTEVPSDIVGVCLIAHFRSDSGRKYFEFVRRASRLDISAPGSNSEMDCCTCNLICLSCQGTGGGRGIVREFCML
jgi:hypothetical protein